ncbi:MAG: TolC family protein [Parahaliea sp.]
MNNCYKRWYSLRRYGALVITVILLNWQNTALAQSNTETAPASLSLAEALSLSLANNPSLQAYAPQLEQLKGEEIKAGLKPALELGLDIENALGSGDFSDTDAAEYTLSLSSVIERGDKRKARLLVSQRQIDLLSARRSAQAMDLLASVTRQYISTLALQEKVKLAEHVLNTARSLKYSVKHLVDNAASPQAELLRAQATETRASLDLARASALYDAERATLAAILGTNWTMTPRLSGRLTIPTDAVSFDALWTLASNSLSMLAFASEIRVREAEVDLARTNAHANISWQLGTRYFNDSNDTALIAGISMPLFSGRRNQGNEQSAHAARQQSQLRQQVALIELRARLYRAYREYDQLRQSAIVLQEEVIPMLHEAFSQARGAYERGRYSYIEWMSAHGELIAAETARIDSIASAALNQAFIEQLSASSLTAFSTKVPASIINYQPGQQDTDYEDH